MNTPATNTPDTAKQRVDFVIVTALDVEARAVVARLAERRVERYEERDIRTYRCGTVPIRDGERVYRVVVVLLPNMGEVSAATAVTDAITCWRPQYVLMVGIAGGIPRDDLDLGDVVVADQVIGYEYGKETADGFESRDRVYPASALLLDRVHNFWDDGWATQVGVARPGNARRAASKRFVGPIASGNKVIASTAFRQRLVTRWPKLIAVEMEAEGVFAAVFDRPQIQGTLVIRGICDLADERKADEWQAYAANAAAAYVISFLKDGPVEPLAQTPASSHPIAAQQRPVTPAKNHHFISYSALDGETQALELYDAIKSGPSPLPVWIDKRDVQRPGSAWDVQVEQALQDCASLLLVLTSGSAASGNDCEREWRRALRYKKPIVSLRFDTVYPPFYLEGRSVVDFTGDFNAALDRLRSQVAWLKTPGGMSQSRQHCLADAQRDLRSATPAQKVIIKQEMILLQKQIAAQQVEINLPIHIKPTRNGDILPQINTSHQISLTGQEIVLLRHVHRGSHQVIVENEFGGGYSGTRVLLTLPIAADGSRKARKVTKLGPALELRRERDTYRQFVENILPFCAALVKEYYEQGDWAGLNYIFVGSGALGQTMDLEKYYSQYTVEQIVETLDDLLDRELGYRWYSQTAPLNCLFAAEYGRHMVEYLRLRLRPVSLDMFWAVDQPPITVPGYQQVDIYDIPHQYETIQPGTLLSVEGLVVKKVKHDGIELEDPGRQGIIVRVEFDPDTLGMEIGSTVGVRGQVLYNRRERMEQIVRAVSPDLSFETAGESIRLSSDERTYPNPLTMYTQILGRTLQGSQSYVHGDLHLRNVLVDTTGRGWLIDFSQVEIRHNIFDFIKMETYIRLMVLANVTPALSLDDYVQFEEALTGDTLGRGGIVYPENPDLRFAHQVIQAIRRIARKYMGPIPDFRNEYLPALFLYCLGTIKYYQEDIPQPTRLVFATACVLSQYILGVEMLSR